MIFVAALIITFAAMFIIPVVNFIEKKLQHKAD